MVGRSTRRADANQTQDSWSQQVSDSTDSIASDSLHAVPKITAEYVDVTCGQLKGRMHTKLFICPGIHQACIEVNGELISPKEFTIRADKSKQKDWKGSIRIGRKSLRILFAMDAFDFFNHVDQCNAKCKSRNYIKASETGKCSKRQSPSFMNLQTPIVYPGYSQPQMPLVNQYLLPGPQSPSGHIMPVLRIKKEIPTCSPIAIPSISGLDNVESSSADSGFDGSSFMASMPQTPEQQLVNVLQMDPVAFWSEIQRSALLEEVIEMIVGRVREAFNHATSPNGAMTLTRVVMAMNMQHDVIGRLYNHQWQYMRMKQESFMQMQHVAQGDHHHVQQAKDCPPSKESFMMMSMNHDSYADTPMEEMIVTDDMHTNNLTDLTTATPKNSTPLMKLLESGDQETECGSEMSGNGKKRVNENNNDMESSKKSRVEPKATKEEFYTMMSL